jgi:predicted acetyltransferase
MNDKAVLSFRFSVFSTSKLSLLKTENRKLQTVFHSSFIVPRSSFTITMASQKTSPGPVTVARASPEQSPVLGRLLELYAHDFSEFSQLELDADGRFGYEPLPSYWTEPGRHPFLVKVNDNLAGFVFIQSGSQVSVDEDVWDVAEFFIVRRYRRSGVGTRAAHDVWSRFQGKWEVRVMERNAQALAFWRRAVSGFTGEAAHPFSLEKDGRLWHVFRFESKHAA